MYIIYLYNKYLYQYYNKFIIYFNYIIFLIGKGTLISEYGERYKGDFFQGERQGIGEQIYRNKNMYIGHWSGNFKNGKGMYYVFHKDVTY